MKLAIAIAGEVVQNGVYSSVKPIGLSENKIHALMDLVPFADPDKDKIHVTVLYSRNANVVTEQPASMRRIHRATISKFVSWVGHDDQPYVVALLDSPELQAANSDWIKLGYTQDFDEYSPHITFKKGLSAETTETMLEILNNALKNNVIALVFGEQEVEPLVD